VPFGLPAVREAPIHPFHGCCLLSNLPVSEHYKFGSGQFPEAHGAKCVQLGRADPHLRPQAELPAVIKPGGRVHQNHR
jgi:hypothetical protein